MNHPIKLLNHFAHILATVIVCLLLIQCAQSAEPSYNGKPLSDWLLLNLSDDNSAKEAIRQIGTNAIPTLIDILGATESNKGRVVKKLKSEDLHKEFRFYGQNADSASLRNVAVDGFAVLGTNAESAVPQLTKLLQNPEIRLEIARALIQVGPKGFRVITNALNDPDLAGDLVWALGENGGADPKVITQLLISALKNPDPITRGNAADFLSGRDANVAVPALIPMLDDRAHYPKERATIALGGYGPAAKSAAPKLLALYMHDPDVHTNGLNVLVLDALRKIDRDAAAQAEAFLVNSGPLNAARFGYTTTLLKNGKELIVGGWIHTEAPVISNRHLSSAELLDPATGKWTETGEMHIARWGHTAILLKSGRVLVVGGYDGGGHDLSSAELYDATTGQWTETGSMNDISRNAYATLQRDGKVRISGYWDGYKVPDDELYDPATGKWTIITKK